MTLRLRLLLAALVAGLGLLAPPVASATSISVQGDHLIDATGRTVQLRGVNRSGTEYACSTALSDGRVGFGIFDGPTGRSHLDDADQGAALDAMRPWGINAVRVPLSDACWFGGSGLNPAYTGTAYQAAILRYVDQLRARGMVAILSLHAASTGSFSNRENRLLPMPDADQGPRFWQSVVQQLSAPSPSSDAPPTNVVYDLFNEPHLEQIAGRDEQWRCWRDGGCEINPVDPVRPGAETAPDPTPAYRTAGMQQLVDEIRARERTTSSPTRPIMVGGLDYANDLSAWQAHAPKDPAPQRAIVASLHAYAAPHNLCASVACWDATVGTIRTAGYPVVAGELGQYDCRADHVARFTGWADAQGATGGGRGGISYLAWTWNAVQRAGRPTGWRCDASPTLLQDFDGTPTEAYGGSYCRHLRARQLAEGGLLPAGDPCPAGAPDTVTPPEPDPTPTTPTGSTPTTGGLLTPTAVVPAAASTVPTVVPPRSTTPTAARTARIASKGLRLRRGRVAVAVACAKGPTPCAGRVQVRTAKKVLLGRRRAVVVLVSAPYSVRAGSTKTLSVAPTGESRRLLRTVTKVSAVATATSAGGPPATRRLTLTG